MAEVRSYNPTLRERMAAALMGDNASQPRRDFVSGLMGSTGLGSTGMGLADLTPLGVPMGVQEAHRAGDTQGMALAVAPFGTAVRNTSRMTKALLPMDRSSQVGRAEQMGFRMDMPLSHGTSKEFNQFDLSKSGATTGAEPARAGVWSEVGHQGIADEFAEKSAQNMGGNPQVMPLVHRTDKPAVIQLDGLETNQEISVTLQDAWDRGFDAVMMKNYTTPGGKSGDILVVKNPSQLRSPYAVFDPAQKHSKEILASLAGLGITALQGQDD